MASKEDTNGVDSDLQHKLESIRPCGPCQSQCWMRAWMPCSCENQASETAVSACAPRADREKTRYLENLDEQRAQPNTELFTYRRAAFFINLKRKTGLMEEMAAAIRININTDGRPIPTARGWRISS